MNRFKFKSNKGFTILEVLISITLLSFVMMGVISLTNNSTETKERVVSEDREKLQVETALSRFEWDFAQIYSPLYFALPYKATPEAVEYNPDETGVNLNTRYMRNERFKFVDIYAHPVPTFESNDKSTFEFFTSSNRRLVENSKQSNFQWVKYALIPWEQDADEKEKSEGIERGQYSWVRYSSATNIYSVDRMETNEMRPQVLLDNVEDLEISYWDETNRKFVTPLSNVRFGQHLLRAVKVSLTWRDSKGIQYKFMRIYRPLWPYFVPDKAEEPQKITPNQQGGNLPPPNGELPPNNGQNPPGGEDD